MPRNFLSRRLQRAVAATFAFACTGVWLESAEAQRESGQALVVLPNAIDLHYNQHTSDHVFFLGEPVIIAVRLLNHSQEEYALPGGRSLEDSIVRNVRDRERVGAVPGIVWTPLAQTRHPHDGRFPIPAENYAEVLWSLRSETGTSLSPGRYDVAAEVQRGGGGGRGGRLVPLSHQVTVQIRPVVSRADRLDYHLHQAIRDRHDGHLEDAKKALNALLVLNRNSAAAYVELGAVSKAEGNCQEAKTLWNRALEIISQRADQESPRFSQSLGLSDWAAGVRTAIAFCK